MPVDGVPERQKHLTPERRQNDNDQGKTREFKDRAREASCPPSGIKKNKTHGEIWGIKQNPATRYLCIEWEYWHFFLLLIGGERSGSLLKLSSLKLYIKRLSNFSGSTTKLLQSEWLLADPIFQSKYYSRHHDPAQIFLWFCGLLYLYLSKKNFLNSVLRLCMLKTSLMEEYRWFFFIVFSRPWADIYLLQPL